jgi:hypothetical protein
MTRFRDPIDTAFEDVLRRIGQPEPVSDEGDNGRQLPDPFDAAVDDALQRIGTREVVPVERPAEQREAEIASGEATQSQREVPPVGLVTLPKVIPIKNADGSFSSELSTSVTIDGVVTLIPTIWEGEKLEVPEATRRAIELMKQGVRFPTFGPETRENIEKATRASQERSKRLGEGEKLGFLGKPPQRAPIAQQEPTGRDFAVLTEETAKAYGVTAPEPPPRISPPERRELEQSWGHKLAQAIEDGIDHTSIVLISKIARGKPLEERELAVWQQIVSEVSSFVFDPATYLTFGLGGILGRKIASKVGQKLLRKVTERAVAGAAGLGAFTAVRHPLEIKARTGEFPGVVGTAFEASKAAALGGAAGVAGLVPRVGLPLEIGTFATGGAAFEGRLPNKGDFISATGVILGIKASNLAGRALFKLGRKIVLDDIETKAIADVSPEKRRQIARVAGEQASTQARAQPTEQRAVPSAQAAPTPVAKETTATLDKVRDGFRVLRRRGLGVQAAVRRVRQDFNVASDMTDAQIAGRAAPKVAEAKAEERGFEEPVAPETPLGTGEKSPTSIKNAVVDRERAARGLPAAMEPARRSFGTVWDEAMRTVESQPAVQDALIFELAKKARPVSDVEDALLLHRQIALQNRYDTLELEHAKAQKANDQASMTEFEAQQEMLLAELLQLYDINKAVGTATSRGLNARKMLAVEDFTLVRMVAMKRKAKGVETLAAGDAEAVTETQRKIADLEARLREHTERITQLEADQASVDVVKQIVASEGTRPRKKRTIAAKAELDAAWKDVEDYLAGRTFANPLDPALISHFVKLAKAHINMGIASFQDFVAAVAARIGKEKSKKLGDALRRAWDSTVAEDTPRPRQDLKTPEGTSRFARKLAKFFVSTGITERNPLIDAVHGELVKAVPDITRRQTMDAISSYGQYSPLSQEALDVLLRDLKGQMQQVAKLEDMQVGRAPLKTGQERRTPSDEERILIQQVNEMKKQGGFDITDPATQLKSALASVKTRLRNQIADLEHQIETKEKIIKKRARVIQDEDVFRLIDRRDVLVEQFNEIFGKPELSNEQRVRTAIASAKRSIAEYERRISERDFTAKRPSKIQVTRELQAFRDRRDALGAELKELRDLANPKKTAQERALSMLKSRLRTRIADYQDRLARKDFAPKVRTKTVLDKEAEKLRHEAERLKAEFLRELEKDRLRRRTVVQKLLSTLPQTLNLVRAILVSYDMSAVGRQGALVNFGNPLKGVRPIWRMFRSFFSVAVASRVRNQLDNRPNAALYNRAGLELMDLDGRLSKREEQYLGRWSQYVPGVPASERAFVTYLNVLRADMFDALAATASRNGTIADADAKAIARYVNVATGRGGVAEFQRAARFLATVFWSPRLAFSRFQYLFLQPLWAGQGVSLRTRMTIAREYAKTLTGITIFFASATAALYALLGPPGDDEEWNVELDPRSSDFMRIRIKDTRIRPLAGLSQTTVLLTRLYTGETKQLRTGKIVAIRGAEVPFRGTTGASVVSRYLRNKLAPVIGTGLDVLSGKNVVGELVTPKTVARDLTIPLSFRDIAVLMKEHGVPSALTLQMLESFGMGVQHYDDNIRKQERRYRR